MIVKHWREITCSIWSEDSGRSGVSTRDVFKKMGQSISYDYTVMGEGLGEANTIFYYPMDIHKAIYTTNAIESFNMTLRKVIKNKRVFPSDESVYKILYLAIGRISKKWTMPIHHWSGAINRFIIEFNYQETE